MVVRMRQRRLLACASAGLLAAGLLIGSAGPASAATTVSISAPKVVLSNQQATISGVVSGSSNGASVRILEQFGGAWKSVAQTTVNESRKYAVKVQVSAGGNAFMAKASGATIATGDSKSVTVYGVTDRGMILYQTNVQRKKHGLPALKRLSSLDTVSQAWTQQMYDSGNFVHNPEYISQYPGSPKAGAENIASGTGNLMTSSNVVAQWMASSYGHRETLLDPKYTHLGVGYVSVGGRAYATQNFAQY